jgi:preprotein translocase subunit SecY
MESNKSNMRIVFSIFMFLEIVSMLGWVFFAFIVSVFTDTPGTEIGDVVFIWKLLMIPFVITLVVFINSLAITLSYNESKAHNRFVIGGFILAFLVSPLALLIYLHIDDALKF